MFKQVPAHRNDTVGCLECFCGAPQPGRVFVEKLYVRTMNFDDDGKSSLSRQTHARPTVWISPGCENEIRSKLLDRPAKDSSDRGYETVSVPAAKYAGRKPITRIVNNDAVAYFSPAVWELSTATPPRRPFVGPCHRDYQSHGVAAG